MLTSLPLDHTVRHHPIHQLHGAVVANLQAIGYLAERLQVRHHSAVELVNRMVTHGMVQRQTGEHDRRLVTVAMSETGERILKDLAAEHIAEIQQTGPRLVAALQQVIESDQIPEPANLNTPKDSGLPS